MTRRRAVPDLHKAAISPAEEVRPAPGAGVRDGVSIALHGLHHGLILIDGAGRDEFAAAHDPVPALAHPELGTRGVSGDPFDDPARPLVLTLASDCADLPERLYLDLLSLSRYPGVNLSLVSGLKDYGYDSVLRLEWAEGEQRGSEVRQIESEGRRRDDAFAAFDGVAPTSIRRPRAHASIWPQPGLIEAVGHMFDAPIDTARRVAREAMAHKTLGNDYIVSPTLVQARRNRIAGWPNELGACTVDEAFALAGLKSRMYAAVPLGAEPNGLVSQSTGLYRDLAVTHFGPRLWRAIGSALGPDALADEAACSDRLLAVRSRLSDLLIARDEILKLGRRDALGPAWGRPFDQGPVSGASGDEVWRHMAYHMMSALNALTAIADNLAWVVQLRSGRHPADDDRTSGFVRLITERRLVSGNDVLRPVVECLQRFPWTGLLVGMLRLRNAFAHREGIDFGPVSTETMTIPMTREAAGLWIGPEAVGRSVRTGEIELDPFAALCDVATFVGDTQLAVWTFPRLIDVVVAAAFSVSNEMLRLPPWRSSRRWLFESPVYVSEHWKRRLWRANLQPRLFGLSSMTRSRAVLAPDS